MKMSIEKCPMCGKKHKIKTWSLRGGLLSGTKIVDKIFCSKRCKKHFDLLIHLNDVKRMIDNNFGVGERRKTSSRRIRRS